MGSGWDKLDDRREYIQNNSMWKHLQRLKPVGRWGCSREMWLHFPEISCGEYIVSKTEILFAICCTCHQFISPEEQRKNGDLLNIITMTEIREQIQKEISRINQKNRWGQLQVVQIGNFEDYSVIVNSPYKWKTFYWRKILKNTFENRTKKGNLF